MSERTEAPTPRKLGEARAEGQVARSVELNAAVALLLGAWLIRNGGGQLVEGLKNAITNSLVVLPTIEFNTAWLLNLVVSDLFRILPGLAIILLVLMFSGVVATVSQTGLLWAHKRIGFHFDRLNPLNGLKRLFSLNGLVELFKALLKLLIVGWVAYSFLSTKVDDILVLCQMDFLSAVQSWVDLAITLAVRVGSVYFILAVADYVYQRWQFQKSMKMTKEEVKEDMKRSEGDPLIRSRIRAQQRRMARMRMMASVKKADVVITNPTHLAVAVLYEAETMRAPKVLAKGAYRIAERIVELARENNVPVIQNIPVARALYRTVNIDQEIPPDLYTALAEVLAYVYRLHKKFYSNG